MIISLNKIRDIKKALSCCSEAKNCNNCPYKEDPMCQDQLNKDALTLIFDYEDTIQQLEAETDKQYEQAKADILGNMSDGGTSCHWCIAQHKAVARKEFAEKLKEKLDVVYSIKHLQDIIDNLLKEVMSE